MRFAGATFEKGKPRGRLHTEGYATLHNADGGRCLLDPKLIPVYTPGPASVYAVFSPPRARTPGLPFGRSSVARIADPLAPPRTPSGAVLRGAAVSAVAPLRLAAAVASSRPAAVLASSLLPRGAKCCQRRWGIICTVERGSPINLEAARIVLCLGLRALHLLVLRGTPYGLVE